MFYALHRAVKIFVWVMVGLLLVWLYQQREALEPVWVWYDVYDNGGLQKTEPLPRVEGEVIQIVDGHSFLMQSPDKKNYSVRMTGFEIPTTQLSGQELKQELQRRAFLKEQLLLKPVRVDITYSNLNSLLGIVYSGGTNLNIYFLTNGLSSFKPGYIKSMPRDVQYKFFSAARWRHKLEKGEMKPEAGVEDGKFMVKAGLKTE